MRLERLILKDFISYEELDYMFENNPLLVQGINLTDDGQKSNGSGKSVLPTAIEQCIAGTNSRGVLDSELIMYGKSQSIIQLFAKCDIRKERIHIEQVINLKGSNQFIVKTQKYGSEIWEPAKYSTAPEGKKFVGDWFAISKEDLFNYFIINNTRFKSFFASSNTEKVALVNRFSDASIIQGVENIDISELEEQLTAFSKLVNQSLGKIELIENSLKEEEERDFEEEMEEKIEELNSEVIVIEGEIKGLENLINSRNLNIPLIQKRISELELSKAANETKKLSIEKEVSQISKEVEESLKKVNEAQELVDKFVVVDFKEKKSVFEEQKLKESNIIKTLKTEKQAKVESKTKILSLIEKLSVKLSGVITCPNCEHQFLLDDDLEKLKEKESSALLLKTQVETFLEKKQLSIDEVLTKVTEIEENISKINTEQSKWNDDKNKLSIAVNSSTESLNKIRRSLNDKELELRSLELTENTRLSNIKTEQERLASIESDNKSTELVISEKKKAIVKIEEQKKKLELGENSEEIERLKTELAVQRKEYTTHLNNQNSVEVKITNKKQWMLNFKQFRMFLANKSLGVIEYHSNRYLQEMGSDLIVKVDGFKVLADSTIKEEITCKIIRNVVERSFKSFSGGERGRLLFSSILANRFMINETHPYGGLDFLSIDEVFEGVDSEGLLALLESAKLLAIPVLLITHVSVEENEDVLTIVKENGVSKIKY